MPYNHYELSKRRELMQSIRAKQITETLHIDINALIEQHAPNLNVLMKQLVLMPDQVNHGNAEAFYNFLQDKVPAEFLGELRELKYYEQICGQSTYPNRLSHSPITALPDARAIIHIDVLQ